MRPDVKVEDDIDIVEVNCHAGDHLSLNQKNSQNFIFHSEKNSPNIQICPQAKSPNI